MPPMKFRIPRPSLVQRSQFRIPRPSLVQRSRETNINAREEFMSTFDSGFQRSLRPSCTYRDPNDRRRFCRSVFDLRYNYNNGITGWPEGELKEDAEEEEEEKEEAGGFSRHNAAQALANRPPRVARLPSVLSSYTEDMGKSSFHRHVRNPLFGFEGDPTVFGLEGEPALYAPPPLKKRASRIWKSCTRHLATSPEDEENEGVMIGPAEIDTESNVRNWLSANNPTSTSARSQQPAQTRCFSRSVLDFFHNNSNDVTGWTGEVEEEERDVCQICFDSEEGRRHGCCWFVACDACWVTFISGKVAEGVEEIECPNCHAIIPYDVVLTSLPMDLRNSLLAGSRPCPSCGHLTTVSDANFARQVGDNSTAYEVTCEACDVTWCFTCQKLWHLGRECRRIECRRIEYRRIEDALEGEEGLREWASQRNPTMDYQLNARRCPSCKAYIERTEGCDHMMCVCGAQFCYSCGKRIFSGSRLRLCKKLLQKIVGCRCW